MGGFCIITITLMSMTNVKRIKADQCSAIKISLMECI